LNFPDQGYHHLFAGAMQDKALLVVHQCQFFKPVKNSFKTTSIPYGNTSITHCNFLNLAIAIYFKD